LLDELEKKIKSSIINEVAFGRRIANIIIMGIYMAKVIFDENRCKVVNCVQLFARKKLLL